MKKRLLSVLLAVALCLSCLTPLALAAAAGSEDNAISADVPEGLRQAASGLTAAPESKATPSYSQIMPHMSMDDACGVVGDTMKLYFALRNRRSYDQWAVMIYQGANTGDDNVVGGTYDSYDTNYEFSDLTLSIDPSELWLAAGTYTVLAFTFTGSIDSPNVIEDSIVSFQFKMVSRAIPLQGISFYGLSADMTVNLNGYLQTCLLYQPTNTTVDRGGYTLTSSNPSVIEISDLGGSLFFDAVGAGKATVTATLAGKSCSVNITVPEPQATTLNILEDRLELHEGDKAVSLTFQVEPESQRKNVTFRSSDPSVVTVDGNGIVQAVGAGSAVITASVGSLKDSCTVNVSAHTGTVTEHKDPTATRTGYDKLTCEVCGEAVTRVIPALFSDVRGDVWYSDGVDYAVEHELMNGMGDGTFAPEQAMTRAQLVTVLWRLAGSPSAAPSNFTDVPQDLWYSKAVAWAQETGVVKGMTETEFAPGQQITRAQAATIFQRYAENAGVDDGQRAELSAYPDQDTVPQWAEAGLRWAVAHAIITGTQLPGSSAVVLDPHGSATRAQMATILMRFVKACSNS